MTDNKNDLDSGERHLSPQAMSDISTSQDKQRLLKLIIEQGILHDSAERPVIARDGKTRLNWVMNFLAISLHADSLRLAAQETLKLLEPFDGRQLATVGTAAVPLLSACIIESQGKYNGLMVRAKRKAYGTASLIDGRINYSESVIVIDDSIGSGTNMLDCIEKLEQSGLHVEGCVCLVRFGYDSGYAKLIDRGYRVSALFDVHEDMSSYHPNDWQYCPYPIKNSFNYIVWDEQRLPDYISPFKAIRQSMMHYWQTGKLLRPPKVFNQPIDTSGGVWLSLRAQDAVFTSQGRHGFWHFPGEDQGEVIDAGMDISRVAWLFAWQTKTNEHRVQRIEKSVFGLSLFGALEQCELGEFDQHQHALVVRSDEAPWKMGGGLPNMPGISSDAHLLHHARFHNTKLYPHEPFQLYRHTVSKLVEPGAEWPLGGESRGAPDWDEHKGIMQAIAEQLLSWVKIWHRDRAWPETVAVPDVYIPVACQWLFLSVYLKGKQVACVGAASQNANDLLYLAKTAAQDSRWQAECKETAEHTENTLYIRVSALSESRHLGCAASLQSFSNFVLGQNAISIRQDQQFAIMLPEVPVQQQWTVEQFSSELRRKAGINQPSETIQWCSYRATTWHVDAKGCHLIRPEKPLPPTELLATQSMQSIRSICADFLRHHRQANGIMNTRYNPVLHQVNQQNALFNTAYVLSLIDFATDDAAEWQPCYEYLATGLQNVNEGDVNHLERSYAVLALLKQTHKQPEARASLRTVLASQLVILQDAFNRHGQLEKPDSELQKSHYGVELRALFTAQQGGFLVDTHLLKKASMRLLRYTQYQAVPREYPSLLSLLAFTTNTGGEKSAFDVEAQPIIEALIQGLLSWQQPSGAFLPEVPELSPVSYTLRVVDALLDAGIESDLSTQDAVKSAVSYLKEQLVLPEHKAYFPAGFYAVGGMYNGLLDGCLNTADTALFMKVISRLSADEV